MKPRVFFFLIAFLLLVCRVWAGEQRVELERVLEDNGTVLDQVKGMQEEAFARAVVQEAASILGGSLLSPEEQQLLLVQLPSDISRFVLAYREQDLVTERFYRKSIFFVRVNDLVLKNWLKQTGLYFCRGKKLTLALNSVDLNAGEKSLLSGLVALFGFVPDPASTTSLQIRGSGLEKSGSQATPARDAPLRREPEHDRSYKVLLRSRGVDVVVSGTDLVQIWFQVWSEYLHRPEIMACLLTALNLQVRGWTGVAGVRSFASTLGHWYGLVDTKRLLRIQLLPAEVSAMWRLETVHPKKLQVALHDLLTPRGLSFNVQLISAPEVGDGR